MKRLLLFALVGAAAWYGWKHQDELRSRGSHEVVAVNHSGQAIERVRVTVGDQTVALEVIEDGATQRVPLRTERDGTFEVVWKVRGRDGERHWTGGGHHAGPILMRHRFEFVSGDGVIWMSERKPGK